MSLNPGKKATLLLVLFLTVLAAGFFAVSNPGMLKTSNGCKLFVICGKVSNDKYSTHDLQVAENWVSDFNSVKPDARDRPTGATETLHPGQSSTGMKDWDAYYIPKGCLAYVRDGYKPLEPGMWHKMSDIQHPEIILTCDVKN